MRPCYGASVDGCCRHNPQGFWLPSPPLEGLSDAELLAYVYRHEMRPSYGASVEAYRQHGPTMYPSQAEGAA